MTGYKAYTLYLAIRSHFTQSSYDFFRYGGRVSASQEAFKKRKDQFSFQRIGKLYSDHDYVGFLVSNFLANPKTYSRDLVSPRAEEIYRSWLKRVEALQYYFEQYCNRLIENHQPDKFSDLIKGSMPTVWQEFQTSENDSGEYLIILNRLTNCFSLWNKTMQNDPLWKESRMKLSKYEPFLEIATKKYAKILSDCLEKNNLKF